MHSICAPYNGQDLVWHPVTPSMSNMSYQSADASKNIKRPNIASFFNTKASKSQTPSTVKPDASTKSPKSSIKASTTKPEAAQSPRVSVKPEHDAIQEASATKSAAPSQAAMQPQQQEVDIKEEAVKAEPSGDVQQVQFPAADGTQDLVAVADPASTTETPEDVALNPDDGGGMGKTLCESLALLCSLCSEAFEFP